MQNTASAVPLLTDDPVFPVSGDTESDTPASLSASDFTDGRYSPRNFTYMSAGSPPINRSFTS